MLLNNSIIIETQNLTKTFLSKEVIRNCNMRVEKGKIYGFLGANGAGKTTVFKMLCGLLLPTMGKVQVLGMDIMAHRYKILPEIGTLIETPVFYEHLSARENLEIHLAYMGKDKKGIDTVLTKVGLDNISNQPVSTFSMGMRQRLAIGRAMVHKPKLLILDEPINGLDPVGIREVRDLFKELVAKEEMTILLSSHILSEIEQIADTIGVISEGTIIREVPMTQVKESFSAGLEDFFMDIMTGGTENENTH